MRKSLGDLKRELKGILTMEKLGTISRFGVALCVLLAVFCTSEAFGDSFVYDFDNSFEGWRWQWAQGAGDAGYPPYPDDPWIGEVTLSDVRGYNDDTSLKFDMNPDGSLDDGTLWIEKAFTISANTPTEVSLSFQLWNDEYSDFNNFDVKSCISEQNPDVQDDFTHIGWTDTAAGWVEHSYQQTVTSSSGQAWVAVGIRVNWETPRLYWIDQVEVSGVLPVPGDVDGDGYVSAPDLTTIITNWGMSGATRQQGDLSGDGTVSAPDYTEVITYWGTGPAPPLEPIPEPATLGLLLIGGLALLMRRHRLA